MINRTVYFFHLGVRARGIILGSAYYAGKKLGVIKMKNGDLILKAFNEIYKERKNGTLAGLFNRA